MKHILFLDIHGYDDDSLRGGALVTDDRTEPIEFRCTDKVLPSRLQRTLWGDRLQGHISVEIIARPLLESLTHSPDLILIRLPELIELRQTIDVPLGLFHFYKGDDISMVKMGSYSLPTNGDEDAEVEKHVGVHKSFPEDLEDMIQNVKQLTEYCKPTEPFERISSSLDLIEGQHKSN